MMMSCRTGLLSREQVESTLAELGWCPDHDEDSAYLRQKKADVLARLPGPVQAELAAKDPVLITTFPNVWGLASFDRRNLLVLCLLGDDLEMIKRQGTQIAVSLPRALARLVDGRQCEFDPHVEIRRYDGNGLITHGVISATGHVPFRHYAWAVRRRERVTLLVLGALAIVSTGVALLLYVRFPGGDWPYVRGYLDRFGSAVLTAALITFVNLVFEYRDWRGGTAVIEWSLPALT
jgi:hypothetical protein